MCKADSLQNRNHGQKASIQVRLPQTALAGTLEGNQRANALFKVVATRRDEVMLNPSDAPIARDVRPRIRQ